MSCNVLDSMTSNVPKLLPEAAMPIAVASRVEKYVDMMATLGTNKVPTPMPMQNACANNACQKVVHKLSIIWPKTIRKEPVHIKNGTCPES